MNDDNQVRNELHRLIGEFLTRNEVDFKEDVLRELFKSYPNISRNKATLLYDEEYEKWVDAYYPY